jgi:ketosteroid isomerase-like protein
VGQGPPRLTAPAMSEENVEVVRRMYEAFRGGDTASALDCYDHEVEFEIPRPDVGAGRGRENLFAEVGRWVAAFDDWHEEIEEMRDLGDKVYVLARQRGRGKDSGIEIEVRYGLLYELRAEKITRMTMYADPADALKAAEDS